MLVLTRKSQESLLIGDDQGGHHPMKIVVLSIVGNRVKLGFDIDPDVDVERLEVWEQLQTARQTTHINPVE